MLVLVISFMLVLVIKTQVGNGLEDTSRCCHSSAPQTLLSLTMPLKGGLTAAWPHTPNKSG
jgi:hypothetical protein